MFFCSRIAGGGLAFLCFSVYAAGQTENPPEARAPLTTEEIASAVCVDSFSIPTPGELMTALNKQGKLDWSASFRRPIATTYTSRAQMALNLGGLIADGYIAVEAEDAQQVKNAGKDIISLARPLGVKQDIINRGRSLTDFAEQNRWDALKEDLDATQNEVKIAMAENKDQNLVTLVTVGAWVRATEAISGYVARRYTENGAKLLRQPGIVKFLNTRLNALPDKMRDDPVVKKTRMKMIEIERVVSLPRDVAPPPEAIRKLNALSAELLKEIAKKEAK